MLLLNESQSTLPNFLSVSYQIACFACINLVTLQIRETSLYPALQVHQIFVILVVWKHVLYFGSSSVAAFHPNHPNPSLAAQLAVQLQPGCHPLVSTILSSPVSRAFRLGQKM